MSTNGFLILSLLRLNIVCDPTSQVINDMFGG